MSISQISISLLDARQDYEKLDPCIWHDRDFDLSSAGDAESYQALDVVLRAAFERNLPRSRPWDVSSLTERFARPVLRAAQIYKRGVPVVGYNGFAPLTAVSTVRRQGEASRCFDSSREGDLVIADETLYRWWWHKIPGNAVTWDFSEKNKNLETAWRLKDLIRRQCARGSKVFYVGGGIGGDVCGFAAALAGRAFEFVPTTLLSVVDSSVGGKTGVNYGAWGKNQVGLFALPVATHICAEWLSTLPPVELKSGLSEFAKHALIAGSERLWGLAIAASKVTHDGDACAAMLDPGLMDAIHIKSEIVSRDPLERGERRVLNLGHTLGHALESIAQLEQKPASHGVCVAVGIYHALRISEKYLGFRSLRYREDLRSMSLMPSTADLRRIWGDVFRMERDKNLFARFLLHDKKNSGDGSLSFVLMSNFGETHRGSENSWVYKIPFENAWQDIVETWRDLTGEKIS